MPTFSDTRDRVAPSFTHPMTEVLSDYLAMTAPERTSPGSPAETPDRSAQSRAEELWDALGDFA